MSKNSEFSQVLVKQTLRMTKSFYSIANLFKYLQMCNINYIYLTLDVTQGYHLGPILFSELINDIPKLVDLTKEFSIFYSRITLVKNMLCFVHIKVTIFWQPCGILLNFNYVLK